MGLFTGVLVDLTDRKKIIVLIDFFLAICFFSLILFKDSYPAILLITFIINSLGQFYAPAEASAIPLIVPKEKLMAANSLFSATLYSCFLLGFGMAGPLINYFGINLLFGLGGILLLIAFFLAFFFPSIKATPDQQGKKLIAAIISKNLKDIKNIGLFEILKTIRLIRGKLAVLTSIVILGGVQMVIGILAVLMPAFLERSLKLPATDASYILVIPLGFGIVLGGLILGRIGQKFIRRILVARAIVVAGFLFILMAITTAQAVFILGAFLLGISMVTILVPSQTVLQENTPDTDRGKVYATLGVAMAGLSLIPVFLAGVLADLFGVNSIFISVGAVIIIVGLFGLKPSMFFQEEQLSYKTREFLGLGHWEKDVSKTN